MNWAEFFAMGGRGFYVWGSYGAVALFVFAELFLLHQRRKRLIARLLRGIRQKKRTPSGETKA